MQSFLLVNMLEIYLKIIKLVNRTSKLISMFDRLIKIPWNNRQFVSQTRHIK